MTFILSDLYLIKKFIFNEHQITNLLDNIFIFCVHSQYQLLIVAIEILKENLNEPLKKITQSFIDYIKNPLNSFNNNSQYLKEFLQYISDQNE